MSDAVQTYSVELNDRELSLLNGSCSDKNQTTVDAALLRIETQDRLTHLTHRQAAFEALVDHGEIAEPFV